MQFNLKNLEVTKAGIVQEVVKHYKDLIMLLKLPFSYATRYSTTPYCFLVAVKMNIGNPLLNTLISKAN